MQHGDVNAESNLALVREEIDRIDTRILSLLSRRGELALKARDIKEALGLPLYDSNREKALLERLTGLNQGPFSNEAIDGVFREIVRVCRSIEQPLRVAFLGPLASFSHKASLERFGPSGVYEPMGTIEDVFEAVEHRRVDVGVVPVESSIEGGVTATLDRLAEMKACVIEERILPVELALLGNDTNLDSIREIYSHPQALGQCRQWLLKRLPGASLFSTESTAKASMLVQKRQGAAAVASKLAAQLYGLEVIEDHIEDVPFNQTRFFVLAMRPAPQTGNDKTSALVKIKDEPGALFRMLAPFSSRGINLSKIESRPSRSGPFNYVFFLDFSGHALDPEVEKAITEVRSAALWFKVLGSYPKA